MDDTMMDVPGQVRRQMRAVDAAASKLAQEIKILKGLVEELPPPPAPTRPPFYVRWYNWAALNLVNQLPLPR